MRRSGSIQMKFTRRQATALLATPAIFHAAATVTPTKVAATDTASPEFLEAVQSAMLEYIDATAMEGKHLIFDAVKGDYVQARNYLAKEHDIKPQLIVGKE